MHTTWFLVQVVYLELKKLLAAGRLEDRKPRRIMPFPSEVAHVRLGLIDHSGPAHAFAHLCEHREDTDDVIPIPGASFVVISPWHDRRAWWLPAFRIT